MKELSTKKITSFECFNLKKELLYGLFSYGYEIPTEIQKKAICPIIEGKDLLAQAQSGTGKTGAFSVGVLQRITSEVKRPQAVVLSPTRELAIQTGKFIEALSDYMDLSIQICVGGTKLDKKEKQIVSGTPGRILDLLRRKFLNKDEIKIVVLDEVDEMFSKGLKDKIKEILRLLGEKIQLIMVSATFSETVLEATKLLMKDPVEIFVERDKLTLKKIRQFSVFVEEEWKIDALCDLYTKFIITQAVIFCSTKKKVIWLTERMHVSGFIVSSIHGDLLQTERDNVTDLFRKGITRILITTDILSRGIDIQQISLVINFDLPVNVESYLHRIGRSGRYRQKGLAINFVSDQDKKKIKEIEEYYSISIPPIPADTERLNLEIKS